jgi:hypothetical protein
MLFEGRCHYVEENYFEKIPSRPESRRYLFGRRLLVLR